MTSRQFPCGMAHYEIITPSMSEAVLQHLRESFFADEPLNKAVSLCQRGESHAALERLCAATMTDGLSIAAMEGDMQSIEKIQQSSDEKYNKIFTILYTVSRDLDLFNTYQVNRILECRIISVSEQARGRGLAKELMARSVDLAKEQGFKLFKVDATGAYSQRICKSLGLQELKRVVYSEYCDDTGEPIFNVSPPHNALSVMVLTIP
ncbi:hypothetical protein K1T71_008428 [Dendrolimus kikuchii]|uniref:Uncharacterized protein n=1 Tax=Dendrolimus kikuchii TaxID=765133 RepID=A0ACC1CX23_9NEOP|nr:hypothetical protein K1T71_008428 [Dendrolimus kikuchii]